MANVKMTAMNKIITKILPFLWMLFGLILILTGILFLYLYNRPGVLYLIGVPNYCSISQIILGVYSILFGIKIHQKSKNVIFIGLLTSIYILSMTIGSIFFDLLSGYFVIITWMVTFYYLPIILFVAVSRELIQVQNIELRSINLKETYKRKRNSILFYTIILTSITIIIARLMVE